MSWWKQPLLHFLTAGAVLFTLFEAFGGPAYGDGTIRITRPAILEFMQYRNKAFQAERAEQTWEAFEPDERQRLIDEYVREEALFREALALGLDRDDYLIKRRLVQKLEFLSQGFAAADAEPSEQEVADYFEQHKADYYLEPHATFTHVFFDSDKHGADKARGLAERELAKLNRQRVSFSEAVGRGDRFPFHLNYVERVPDFVGAHFGQSMAKGVFELAPDEHSWRGPFQSEYGSHVVLLTRREEGRLPALDEMRSVVVEDAKADKVRSETEAEVATIVDKYEVEIDEGVQTR